MPEQGIGNMKAPMTVKGAQRLRAELDELKSVKRPAVIHAIAEARAHGDLKENAEYHAAREQQSFIEGRIKRLEGELSHAQLIDVAALDAGTRVDGLSAIRVLREHRGREWGFCLDPVYGRFNHVSAEPCEEGLVAPAACPRCRATLVEPDGKCERCGAPTFAVRGPGNEPIRWCTRTGCHFTWWGARGT